MTTLLAQLTDLHVRERGVVSFGRIDTAACLRAAVKTILGQPQVADAVVITGDLTDFGTAPEYAHVAELLAPLRMPVYLMPGNHDDRAQLRASFPGHRYLGLQGFIQYAVSVGPWRLLALDTTVRGQPHGELCEARLAWLAEQLEDSRGHPVIVAMHHPPFCTLIGHMDNMGLREGAQAFEALIAQHSNVERVICGHVHRAIDIRFAGTIASVAPSTAHQIVADFSPGASARWNREPPAFRVYASSEAGVVGHTVASGEYAGPYTFENE